MKTLSEASLLLFLFVLLFPSAGCASITTWENTGVEICRVNDAEIKRMDDGSFQLVQDVSVTREYLPFLSFLSQTSEEKRTYSFPEINKITDPKSYVFILKPDNRKSTILSMRKGFLVCKEYLSPRYNDENMLNDSDLSLLKNHPFVVRNLASCRADFLIPYEAVSLDNGNLKLNCYAPPAPPVILNDKDNDTCQTRMEGAGITCLRIVLLPIPVLIDVATLPFLPIGLLLVYSMRC